MISIYALIGKTPASSIVKLYDYESPTVRLETVRPRL